MFCWLVIIYDSGSIRVLDTQVRIFVPRASILIHRPLLVSYLINGIIFLCLHRVGRR